MAGVSSNEDTAQRSNELVRQGKDLIEWAFARSKGKIAGPHGAAEIPKLKTKALQIDRHGFERTLAERLAFARESAANSV
jgi:hypothetical protein